MKLRSNVWLVVVSLALFRNASGQSFVNLNFEDATIVPDLSSPYYPYAVYASQAIPGWTTVGFLGPNDILYNDLTLGTPNVSLLGLNDQYGPAPLDGAFSIILQAYAYGESPSISQTSLVPATAESLFFKAQAGTGSTTPILQVSLGGQDIPFSAISTGANYTLYGGNIPSTLEGQVENLTFSAFPEGGNTWEIDNIQFSPSSVPEPTTLGLIALGALLFGLRRSKNSPLPGEE
jgi:hypothetical protein